MILKGSQNYLTMIPESSQNDPPKWSLSNYLEETPAKSRCRNEVQQGPQSVAEESTFPATRESKTVLGRVLVLPGGSGGEAWASIWPFGSILKCQKKHERLQDGHGQSLVSSALNAWKMIFWPWPVLKWSKKYPKMIPKLFQNDTKMIPKLS